MSTTTNSTSVFTSNFVTNKTHNAAPLFISSHILINSSFFTFSTLIEVGGVLHWMSCKLRCIFLMKWYSVSQKKNPDELNEQITYSLENELRNQSHFSLHKYNYAVVWCRDPFPIAHHPEISKVPDSNLALWKLYKQNEWWYEIRQGHTDVEYEVFWTWLTITWVRFANQHPTVCVCAVNTDELWA